jgi:hypothetical protein
MSEPQPIDSAPTDREILVFNDLYGWYRSRRVPYKDGFVYPLYGLSGRQGGVWYPVPSYWAELPPTPAGRINRQCGVTTEAEYDLREKTQNENASAT